MLPCRRLAVAAALTAAVVIAGCGDGRSPGPEDLEIDLVVGARVTMADFAFEPDDIVVTGGELVTFTNRGDQPHTATADDGAFDSGEQRPGETFTYITDPVDEAQEIELFCELHPNRMRATLTIEPRRERAP